jgi:hypothetical protein
MLRTVAGLVSAFGPSGLAGSNHKSLSAERSPFAISAEEIARFATSMGAVDRLNEQLYSLGHDPQWKAVHDWAAKGARTTSGTHRAAVAALEPTAQASPLIASLASTARDTFVGLRARLSPEAVRNAMRGQIPETAARAIGLAPVANGATSRFVVLQNGLRHAAEFCAEPLPAINSPSAQTWERVTAAVRQVQATVDDGLRSIGNIHGMWQAIGADLRRVGTDMKDAAAEMSGPVDEGLVETFAEALELIIIQWERVATDCNAFATTTNDLVRRIS